MGNDNAPFVKTTTNVTGGDVYRTARLSPTSLRYYGRCLRRGSYKVWLHFAEIMPLCSAAAIAGIVLGS
ncbi:hypothetical protein L6452_22233 [Arctium lappa]|uniref:Uncharacterized protein n=1 Tax=Arctium lappa TaxID=4217 RepID=A0ACB9AYE5_ARCLA|nr:hypothetical protein L6452_22233 [Arctium lappa]